MTTVRIKIERYETETLGFAIAKADEEREAYDDIECFTEIPQELLEELETLEAAAAVLNRKLKDLIKAQENLDKLGSVQGNALATVNYLVERCGWSREAAERRAAGMLKSRIL